MKWEARIVSRTNRDYTSGVYKILASWYQGGAYTLFIDGKYAGSFQHLAFAKKNAERHAETGRFIGGGVPQFVVDAVGVQR